MEEAGDGKEVTASLTILFFLERSSSVDLLKLRRSAFSLFLPPEMLLLFASYHNSLSVLCVLYRTHDFVFFFPLELDNDPICFLILSRVFVPLFILSYNLVLIYLPP